MKTVYLLSEYRPHGSSLLIISTAIKNLPPCHSFTVQFFLLLYFRHCTNCFHVIHSLFNFFLDSVQISLRNKHSLCGRAAYTVQVRMDVFRALWTFITMVVKGHWRQEGQGIWGQPAGNPYWKFSVFWVSFLLNFWVFCTTNILNESIHEVICSHYTFSVLLHNLFNSDWYALWFVQSVYCVRVHSCL